MVKKIVKCTEEEIKKMKGATNWAVLVEKNKNPNNKIQRTQKTRH